METDLQGIQQKPSDYKVCRFCNYLNWYENEECYNCQDKDKKFRYNEKDVLDTIESELDFWIKEEGYTEREADNVMIDV